MTKNQYFKELKKQLKLYAVKESEDILKDYEEHDYNGGYGSV